MRTSKSKALQWERRDLLSRMRPKCGPNLDLLRTISRYFHQNAVKSLKSTFCDKSAMLFIIEGLLYHPISIELHVLTLVLNLIDSSLSLFHSFAATFLSWLGKWDLLIEMRPKCGPFHQFGPHADQVRNCGLLWKQWIYQQYIRTSYTRLAVEFLKVSSTNALTLVFNLIDTSLSFTATFLSLGK